MLRPYTLNIDEQLMQAAKSRAVQERTSVSEIVRRLLCGYLGIAPDRPGPSSMESSKIIEILTRYSRGEIRRSEAMRGIGLSLVDLDRFNALMHEFDIPWPEPDRARAEQQGAAIAGIIAAQEGNAR